MHAVLIMFSNYVFQFTDLGGRNHAAVSNSNNTISQYQICSNSFALCIGSVA